MSRVLSRLHAILLAAPLAVSTASSSRAQIPAPAAEPPSIHFSADEVQYDETLGIVTATGHVEVQYEDRLLSADTITYNQRRDMVTATGNIVILEPTGEVTFAEYAEVSGDLKNGIAQDLRLVLADKSRLAANGARMTGGTQTELSKAVYSPCELCRDNPERPPLWQIKSVRVLHDKDRKQIEYKDAWLELGGIPVAYTPYLSHPDPTVKRRSGFLAPSFGNSGSLGFLVRTPYFWAIDEESDATFTPTMTSSEGPVLAGQYRKRTQHGRFEVDASLTQDSAEDVRGHIDALGRFDIDPTWRSGFDLQRTTDDTYMRRYKFPRDDESTLTSRAFAEGFRGRNYARVEGLAFQNLRTDIDSAEIPYVLPWLSYSHVGQPTPRGAYTTLDTSLLALTRYGDGRETRRLSSIAGWHLPYTGPMGDVYRLSATLQTDVYHVNNHLISDDRDFDGASGRAFPQLQLDWRYPFIRPGANISQTVEPIVSFIASPHGQNPERIPNEDSIEIEFDDTNLFSSNRFSGVDRIETGPRVAYGLQWSAYHNRGGSVSALVGQSYRLHEDDSLPEGSGLEDQMSDYVGRLQVSPGKYLSLGYRTRLDHDDLAARRNEFSMSSGTDPVKLSLSYSFFDQLEGSEFTEREQISSYLETRLTRFWRTGFSLVRDMTQGTGGWRTIGLRLAYEDECFLFTTDVRREFYQDRDLNPETVVLFGLSFKTLGDVQASAF